MPIYKVTTEGEADPRLVKADSKAQAINFCARGRYSAETVSKVEDVADLLESGVRIEKAIAEPAEGKPEEPPASDTPPSETAPEVKSKGGKPSGEAE